MPTPEGYYLPIWKIEHFSGATIGGRDVETVGPQPAGAPWRGAGPWRCQDGFASWHHAAATLPGGQARGIAENGYGPPSSGQAPEPPEAWRPTGRRSGFAEGGRQLWPYGRRGQSPACMPQGLQQQEGSRVRFRCMASLRASSLYIRDHSWAEYHPSLWLTPEARAGNDMVSDKGTAWTTG